jgi:hypothetical protein
MLVAQCCCSQQPLCLVVVIAVMCVGRCCCPTNPCPGVLPESHDGVVLSGRLRVAWCHRFLGFSVLSFHCALAPAILGGLRSPVGLHCNTSLAYWQQHRGYQVPPGAEPDTLYALPPHEAELRVSKVSLRRASAVKIRANGDRPKERGAWSTHRSRCGCRRQACHYTSPNFHNFMRRVVAREPNSMDLDLEQQPLVWEASARARNRDPTNQPLYAPVAWSGPILAAHLMVGTPSPGQTLTLMGGCPPPSDTNLPPVGHVARHCAHFSLVYARSRLFNRLRMVCLRKLFPDSINSLLGSS